MKVHTLGIKSPRYITGKLFLNGMEKLKKKKYKIVKTVAIIVAVVSITAAGFVLSYSSVNPKKENANNIENNIEKENTVKPEEEKETVLQSDESLENQKNEGKINTKNESVINSEKEDTVKSEDDRETVSQSEKPLKNSKKESAIDKESKIDTENQGAAGPKDESETLLQQDRSQTEADGESKEEKYLTYSEGGNVNIGVIFMNPISKDLDTLEFMVMLDTHSEDLARYKELNKFVELRTDNGLVVTEGFVWEAESDEGHHVSGSLKIKNSYKGKPILDSNTGYLKLVFKNIASVKEREHVYQDDTLR